MRLMENFLKGSLFFATLFALMACSKSRVPSGPVAQNNDAQPQAVQVDPSNPMGGLSLTGFWATPCINDPNDGPYRVTVNFPGDDTVTFTVEAYDSVAQNPDGTYTCQSYDANYTWSHNYTFLVSSQHSQSAPNANLFYWMDGTGTIYDIVSLQGSTLYFGDTYTDPSHDGSSPSNTPSQLYMQFAFTKGSQPGTAGQ